MATEVPKRLINVEEYYKMAVGILKPEDHVELINGEIYQLSPIGSRHAAIVDHLAMIFNEVFQRAVIVRVQKPIRINDNNEPEPDVALVKNRPDFYADSHPIPAEVLAVIEVAGASIRFDKEIKTPLYASCGIPKYWIIDMEQNQVEVFFDPKGDNYSQIQKYKPGEDVTLIGRIFAVKDILM